MSAPSSPRRSPLEVIRSLRKARSDGRPIDPNETVACQRALAEALERRVLFAVTTSSLAGPSSVPEGNVANFTANATSNAPSATVTVSVNFGDGASMTTTVGGGVNFNHTYTGDEGAKYSISATFTDGTSASPSYAYCTVNIVDASLGGSATTVQPVEGASFGGTLLHFTDANPYATTADYTATATFGDGTAQTSAVVAADNGAFDVTAPHTFAEEGTFNGSVTVTDDGGQTITTSLTSTVSDAPLTVTNIYNLWYNAQVNNPSPKACTFSDADPAGAASDYSGTVDYGDGTPVSSDVTIQAGSSGGFDVFLNNHTYQNGGTYTVKITVNDVGGASFTLAMQAVVAGGTVHELDFSAANPADFHPVTSDLGVAYNTAQWLDGASYPICYTRSGTANDWTPFDGNSYVAANATLKVSGFLTNEVCYVKANINGVDTPDVAATLSSNNTIATAYVTAASALPNVIALNNETIKWYVSNDGTDWSPAGTTVNRAYIINARALTSTDSYETELNIGCSNAAGKWINTDVVNGIWSCFASLTVNRIDGVTMLYNHDPGITAGDAAGMLAQTNGKGQCTAWEDLLVQSLAAQGVAATKVQINPISPYTGFEVYKVPAQGSAGGLYPTIDFVFHEVVTIPSVFPNRIYDPSYGTITDPPASGPQTLAAAEQSYEPVNIAFVYYDDSQGVRHYFPDRTGDVTFTLGK